MIYDDNLQRAVEFFEKIDREECQSHVEHPSHYNTGKYECLDVMRSVFGDQEVETFERLNAFKYLWRCQHKGKYEEDLEKAAFYLNDLLEHRKAAQEDM